MKVIIAGSRNIDSYSKVAAACEKVSINITEVVSGCARGVDTYGEDYAHKIGVPVKRFPADWNTHGRKAGPLRNIQMGDYADALIAVWDGKSRGTKHMIEYMEKLGKPVFIHLV